jgi:hypothetical protein
VTQFESGADAIGTGMRASGFRHFPDAKAAGASHLLLVGRRFDWRVARSRLGANRATI